MAETKTTVFDALINEVTRNFADIVEGIRSDYNGEPKDGFVEEPDTASEDAPEQEADLIDIDTEIVRLLKKAENAADLGHGSLLSGEYLSIVDRLMILRREV